MKCDKGWYGRYDLHTRWRCNRCKPRNEASAKIIYALLCAGFAASIVWLAFSKSGQTFFILVADTQGGAADDVVAAVAEFEELQSNDSRDEDSDPDVDTDLELAAHSNLASYLVKIKALISFYQIIAAVPFIFNFRNLRKPTVPWLILLSPS